MIAASCSSTRAGGPEAAMPKATPPAMARSATALNSRRKRELPPNRGGGPCAGVRLWLKSGSRTARDSEAANFGACGVQGTELVQALRLGGQGRSESLGKLAVVHRHHPQARLQLADLNLRPGQLEIDCSSHYSLSRSVREF